MSLVRRLLLEFPDVQTTSSESTGISHRLLDLRGDLSAGAPSPATPQGFRPASQRSLCLSLSVSVSLSLFLSVSLCLSLSLVHTDRQTHTHTHTEVIFFSS